MTDNNSKKDEKNTHVSCSKDKKDHSVQGPDKNEIVTISLQEYQELKDEASKVCDLQGRVLRMQADFDNARKRMEKQSQDFAKYANECIVLELLTILDDLERTVQVAVAGNANPQVFLKGIEMILAHLYEMIKEHGVRPIEVVGKVFDPHTSEVLMQAESDLPENTIIGEMQKGYMLNDRVLRTAKVKVGKHKLDNKTENNRDNK